MKPGAPSFRKAIIFSKRPEVADVVRTELREVGMAAGQITSGTNEEETVKLMQADPIGLLVVDWDAGKESVVRILAASRSQYKVEVRPIFLFASEMSDRIMLTGAEYGVSQVHVGAISRENVKEKIQLIVRTEQAKPDVREGLVKVAACRAKGDWDTSGKILQELTKKHPKNSRIAAELAENFLFLGNVADAQKILESLVAEEPPYVRAIHLMGRCCMRQGDHEKARALFNRANAINPINVERLVDLGNTLLQLDELGEAKMNFDAALKVDPNSKEARVGRGTTSLMEGDVNAALSLLREVSSGHELASIFNTSAVMSMRQGRFEEGMQLYQAALKALGEDKAIQAKLFFNSGIGFMRWRKPEEAAAAFQKAIACDENFGKAQEYLAKAKSMPLAQPLKKAVGAPTPAAEPSDVEFGGDIQEEKI